MHWEGGREIYFHTAHASTAQYPPLCTELSLGRAEEAFQLDFAGNWRVVLRLLPLLHGALLGRRGSCLLPAAISLLLRRGVARHLRWRSRVNSEISTRWDMQTWDSHSSRLLTFVTLALLPIELDSVHAAVQEARAGSTANCDDHSEGGSFTPQFRQWGRSKSWLGRTASDAAAAWGVFVRAILRLCHSQLRFLSHTFRERDI